MKCSLGIFNFLEEISSLSHSIVSLYSFHCSLRNVFLSLLAILWNSAFESVYLSFSPLLFTSLLFTAICKASSDSPKKLICKLVVCIFVRSFLGSDFSSIDLYVCFSDIIMLFWKLQLCESEVPQSCPILCNPMDCSLPSSSVHGIFQARVLEWVSISFSRGSSQPRDLTQVFHIACRCFTIWATSEAPNSYVVKSGSMIPPGLFSGLLWLFRLFCGCKFCIFIYSICEKSLWFW